MNCGGNVREAISPLPKCCPMCGGTFKPRDVRQLVCSPCAPMHRRIEAAKSARKRYADAKSRGGGGHNWNRGENATGTIRKPWEWLHGVVDDDCRSTSAKRTILHTLEHLTETGEWPYVDVLAGVGPYTLDECQYA